MTTSLKWLRMVALIALLAIVATACASDSADDEGDDGEETTESTDEPTEEEEPAEEEEPTEDEMAEDEPTEEDEPAESAGDGEALSLAYLLPETGQLAFLGPPMIGAYNYAIEVINEAGGTNGVEVASQGQDAGEPDGSTAPQAADTLLGNGVHAIIGAAATANSLAIIDTVTGAGVVMCSPSNTGATFTNYDDDGLYFRAAIPDTLQGVVLAEQIVEQGGTNVALLARADDYGQGLLDTTVENLESLGATVALSATYDPAAASFDAEVGQLVDSGADAYVLISFEEGADIVRGMIENGIGPADALVFGADGLRSDTLNDTVDPENPNVLDGMYFTSPAPSDNEEFLAALQESAGDLEDTLFAAEAFDCTIATALAAHAGGENTSEAIAANLNDVTREGTTCTSYAECLELLDAGEDIDYDGASGPMNFSEAGEPTVGVYSLAQFQDGSLTDVTTITAGE